jgi:hypothetical protein
MKPQHRQARFVFERLRNLRDGADRQAKHGGHPRAGREKVAARNALGLGMFPNGGAGVGGHILRRLGWFKFLFALTFCRGQKINQSNLAIL